MSIGPTRNQNLGCNCSQAPAGPVALHRVADLTACGEANTYLSLKRLLRWILALPCLKHQPGRGPLTAKPGDF